MKNLSCILALLLLIFSLCGCRQQPINTSEVDRLNKAFVRSELSEYTVDDTLFIVDVIGLDKKKMRARDIEECIGNNESAYFAFIPRFEGSDVKIEWMEYDGDNDVFFAAKTPFESVSTDDYALLFKSVLDEGLYHYRVTITYGDQSATFKMLEYRVGRLEYPHVADGYIQSSPYR